ncbi:MAG: hypothetical protein HGA38_05305 [Candidatus Moranbacteria bacterium]|nr:hypothetical protein [Candidatus Moranbacteria bacterium]
MVVGLIVLYVSTRDYDRVERDDVVMIFVVAFFFGFNWLIFVLPLKVYIAIGATILLLYTVEEDNESRAKTKKAA